MELAACAEMLFLDLPFADRVRRIAERGFLVEIWDRTTEDVEELAATGARFSSMTGYVTGTLADPDGATELLRPTGAVTSAMWLTAARTLAKLAEPGERAGPAIGEIQVADVPGRREPGTGEIHYPAVAAALRRMEYAGVVGLEGWASGDPDPALDRFAAAFAG